MAPDSVYDPVGEPEFRSGQRVIALDRVGLSREREGGPYETTVRALRITTHGPLEWLYEVDSHPRYGGRAVLVGRSLIPVPAVVQLAALVGRTEV